jgi:hypothetical protein
VLTLPSEVIADASAWTADANCFSRIENCEAVVAGFDAGDDAADLRDGESVVWSGVALGGLDDDGCCELIGFETASAAEATSALRGEAGAWYERGWWKPNSEKISVSIPAASEDFTCVLSHGAGGQTNSVGKATS